MLSFIYGKMCIAYIYLCDGGDHMWHTIEERPKSFRAGKSTIMNLLTEWKSGFKLSYCQITVFLFVFLLHVTSDHILFRSHSILITAISSQ